jgi:hypothetical protein
VITERLTFRAKYGQGDQLLALLKENLQTMPMPANVQGVRLYTDATGPMFSVAFEIDHPDLQTFAANTMEQGAEYGTKEFQDWFAKMVECTEHGERQLFNSEKIR